MVAATSPRFILINTRLIFWWQMAPRCFTSRMTGTLSRARRLHRANHRRVRTDQPIRQLERDVRPDDTIRIGFAIGDRREFASWWHARQRRSSNRVFTKWRTVGERRFG